MAEKVQKYVCRHGIGTVKRTQIAAGVEFEKADIVPATFDAFVKSGAIVPIEQAEKVKPAAPVGRQMVNPNGITPPNAGQPQQTQQPPATPVAVKDDKGSKGKMPAGKVWDFDPKEMVELKHEVLLSVYQEQCKTYNIEPVLLGGTKEQLIAQMSSEFQK